MAQDTGRIVQWLKKHGEAVTQGEPLLEIETDKSVVEIEAPASGVLSIVVPASDDDVPVASVIGYIGTPEELTEAKPPADEAPPAVEAAPASEAIPAASPGQEAVQEAPRLQPERTDRVPMSPRARRLARERGLDPRTIAAASQGPLHAADVERAVPPAVPEEGEFRRYTTIQEITARRTTESWQNAPHFYLMRDVDVTAFKEWLQVVRDRFASATLTDLLIRVSAAALKEFPDLNASPEGKGVRRHAHVNVGIAVAMDQGLVVPVLKAAELKSLGEIVKERAALVERARQGRVDPADLTGGTFTISNLGMFQVDRFLPVLNAPQALLLAVGAIEDRPVVREGSVTIRPMMSLTLACDHRVTDGAGAARFLARLAQMIEQPVTLIDL